MRIQRVLSALLATFALLTGGTVLAACATPTVEEQNESPADDAGDDDSENGEDDSDDGDEQDDDRDD